MDLLRFCCYVLAAIQLAELSWGAPIKSKTRSKVANGKSKTDKAVYAHLYEDTKNDVNKAIENAILEASKKATDKEVAMENSEITKKHHTAGKKTKEVSSLKIENVPDEKEEKEESIDEEGSSEEPRAILKAKKDVKKFDSKDKEDLNVVDATEASAAEPGSNNSDEEEKSDSEDDDEPEEDSKKDEKVMPPITEAKQDAPAPAKVEAKVEGKGAGPTGEEGQEDLKQLLDESITNLIKANSAVEVLLRATNERIQAARQPCAKDKKCKLYCYRTLPAEQATAQFMASPTCAQYNCCPPEA